MKIKRILASYIIGMVSFASTSHGMQTLFRQGIPHGARSMVLTHPVKNHYSTGRFDHIESKSIRAMAEEAANLIDKQGLMSFPEEISSLAEKFPFGSEVSFYEVPWSSELDEKRIEEYLTFSGNMKWVAQSLVYQSERYSVINTIDPFLYENIFSCVKAIDEEFTRSIHWLKGGKTAFIGAQHNYILRNLQMVEGYFDSFFGQLDHFNIVSNFLLDEYKDERHFLLFTRSLFNCYSVLMYNYHNHVSYSLLTNKKHTLRNMDDYQISRHKPVFRQSSPEINDLVRSAIDKIKKLGNKDIL